MKTKKYFRDFITKIYANPRTKATEEVLSYSCNVIQRIIGSSPIQKPGGPYRYNPSDPVTIEEVRAMLKVEYERLLHIAPALVTPEVEKFYTLVNKKLTELEGNG